MLNSIGKRLPTMTTSKNNTSGSMDLNGLTERHVAQIIRRKMIQKSHGDKKKYTRKGRNKQEYDQ